MLSTSHIRKLFLDYFERNAHQKCTSANLLPNNDNTLLFVNAGMVPFKDIFLGTDSKAFARATSSQKCIRAGGKHNDLENVGYTARHHTFFEMLGNFSFGDYFKKEAIIFSWEFLTQILKVPKEKLLVTVYQNDDEAFNIWLNDIGLEENRIIRIGDKSKAKPFDSDNFWQMGDTGPCGPCTEIFYDHGESIFGGPPGSPDEDGDRFIEIWNLVFMQYNRLSDGTMDELPKPSVDTGMGLERITAVIQGVHSNYEIDLFQELINNASNILSTNDVSHPSLRVIADHIRSCSFLIADGVIPSHEGRGYVLRRIIRRAVRHGYKLGSSELFFYKMVPCLVEQMGQDYPELAQQQEIIINILKKEEEKFSLTLTKGMKLFDEVASQYQDGAVIDGDTAFKLYDTYGFPIDLTADIARERRLKVDFERFEHCMKLQKEKAKAANKFSLDYSSHIQSNVNTHFIGYSLGCSDATIKQIFVENKSVNMIDNHQYGIIILDKTPFYAESGGQIGDRGIIESYSGRFIVEDTQKTANAIMHHGYIEKGFFALDTEITAMIETKSRIKIAANHSATHLLHAALREVLGVHVKQKGSLVEQDKLRFDFSHDLLLTQIQKSTIEDRVNEIIRKNYIAEIVETTPDIANSMGAMALFGEKYGEVVRVLKFGDFSIELCGGTHVNATGDIGFFKIISDSGISSGIRRIEAVTGVHAQHYIEQRLDVLSSLRKIMKVPELSIHDKIQKMLLQIKDQSRQISQLKKDLLTHDGHQIQSFVINGVTIFSDIINNVDMPILRHRIDEYRSKYVNMVCALATINDHKVHLAVGVSQKLTNKINAGDLVQHIAKQIDGKGGGRADMAQAGGGNPDKLADAMNGIKSWIEHRLQ